MGQLLAAITTGAGVVTPIAGQDNMENCMVIGDVDTACPLRGISVEIGGKTTINIQGSQPLVAAFMKFCMEMTAATVGLMLKFGTGKINASTTYRLTNDGATTPSVYAYSDAPDGKPLYAATVGINALSYADFKNFTGLQITPAANVGSYEVIFKHPMTGRTTKSTLTRIEMDARFAQGNPSEANGQLDAVVTTIRNTDGLIESVRVNATTAVTVSYINFDEADFRSLQAQLTAQGLK